MIQMNLIIIGTIFEEKKNDVRNDVRCRNREFGSLIIWTGFKRDFKNEIHKEKTKYWNIEYQEMLHDHLFSLIILTEDNKFIFQ